MPGKVIVLNGCGSVGKSSVAKALQALAKEPFLHLQGDVFLEMLPVTMYGHPDGIIFEEPKSKIYPAIEISTGPVCDRVFSGMRMAVAAMALEGNNIIVDDVMLLPSDQETYLQPIPEHNPIFIGLFASLEILEQREKRRGDRIIGLARWQFERVHKGIEYDLEIETSTCILHLY